MRKPSGGVTRRRRDGKLVWCARFYFHDEHGRKCERMRVARTKHEADVLLDTLRKEYHSTGYIEVDRRLATFAEVAKRYADMKVYPAEFHHGRKTGGLRSHIQVSFYLESLKQHFGPRRIREIRHSDLMAYRKRRLKTPVRGGGERTITSINRELETMRAVLRFAVREGFVERNPFNEGEPLIVKQHEQRRERVMSFDEEQRLLDVCVDRYAHLRPLLISAVDTGMRRGELFKLTWQDVDFESGFITIVPENEKANRGRHVAMTNRLREELIALQLRRKGKPEDPVFGLTTSIKHGWSGICKEAEIEDLRLHDLRHTCVTRLIESGVAPAAVLKAAGHSTLSMLSRYLNPGDESLTMAAAALDQLLEKRLASSISLNFRKA